MTRPTQLAKTSKASLAVDLEKIIEKYKRLRKASPDTWMEFTVKQKSLGDAIKVASLSINEVGKRCPHQYRLKHLTLNATYEELLSLKNKIMNAKSFDELYNIILSLDVFGLGELTRYDIAIRIGAYLNLFPDRVYLHAGTRVGAKNLLGKLNKDYLLKEDLPKAFQSPLLSCGEIEDILCIFKDDFGMKMMDGVRRRVC